MNRQQTTHRIVLTAIPTHHGAALRQLLYCRPSYRLLDGCLRRPRPSCLAFMKAFISVSNRRQLPVPSVCDDKYRSILGVKFQVSMSFYLSLTGRRELPAKRSKSRINVEMAFCWECHYVTVNRMFTRPRQRSAPLCWQVTFDTPCRPIGYIHMIFYSSWLVVM